MPQTDVLVGLIDRDANGFILTGPDLFDGGRERPQGWTLKRQPFLLETNVPGIFAAGDVRHGSMKRVAAKCRRRLHCCSAYTSILKEDVK